MQVTEALDQKTSANPSSPFCLLLKQTEAGIRLGPKSTLDIPVSFAPEDMRRFEAECVVTVRKEDGSTWRAYPSRSVYRQGN